MRAITGAKLVSVSVAFVGVTVRGDSTVGANDVIVKEVVDGTGMTFNTTVGSNVVSESVRVDGSTVRGVKTVAA